MIHFLLHCTGCLGTGLKKMQPFISYLFHFLFFWFSYLSTERVLPLCNVLFFHQTYYFIKRSNGASRQFRLDKINSRFPFFEVFWSSPSDRFYLPCIELKKVVFLSFLPFQGQLGRSDQRQDEAGGAGRQRVLLRRGSEDDSRSDGERLVPAVPEIQTDSGSVSETDQLRSGAEGLRLGRQQAGAGRRRLNGKNGGKDWKQEPKIETVNENFMKEGRKFRENVGFDGDLRASLRAVIY